MTGGEEDTTSSFAYSDKVTGSWSAHDTILADEKLLNAIGGTNLSDQLCNLWVVVPSITTDDEEGALYTFRYREEDGSNEVLGIVWLLEDLDLLAQTRACGYQYLEQ